jgi:flagellar hook-associated protein 3 FlgL
VRIADKMNYEQVNANLGKNRSEMSELQNQAATQKRVTKPSDDPLAATRVLQTRTEIASGKQFLKSIA